MSKKKKSNDKIWISFISNSRDDVCGSSVLISYPTPNEEKERGAVLCDCGIVQGSMSPEIEYSSNKKAMENVPLEDLSAVFISHAHADHSCGLPIFGSDKFNGSIIMDYETSIIAKDLNKDSVYLHDCLVKNLQSKGKRCKHIFSETEMYKAFDKIKVAEKHIKYKLNDYVSYELYESGHCLGSQIKLYITMPNKQIKTIVYTGDLSSSYNAKYKPYNELMEIIPKANCYIFESTYGASDGREFNKKIVEKEMKELKIKLTDALKNGKRVFIPCFSFARTEEILTLIWNMFKNEKWFNDLQVPIWVDGKLTNKIIERYSQLMKGEKSELWESVRNWSHVRYNKEYKGTEALISARKSGIYISSSGFIQPKTRSCEYVKSFLGSENAIILFVGYSGGENSVAWNIINSPKGKPINIDGSTLIKSCDVYQFFGFSSHIQGQEIINYFKQINTDKILLHHGSADSKEQLIKNGTKELMKIGITTRISGADRYHSTFTL